MDSNFKRIKLFFINKNVILIYILLALIIIVSLYDPKFLSKSNIQNLMQQISVLGILSLGMNILMISGGLDLSIGMNISLSLCTITVLFSKGINLFLALLIGFFISVFCGFVNGIIIAKSNGLPFVITLGTMSIFNGIALVITGGESYSISGKFTYIGQGKIWIFPVSIIIFFIILILTFIILNMSKLGRLIFAIGGNEKAAYFSGIKVDRVKILLYTLNGIIVGLAALVLLSRLGSAVPATGSGYELRTIAAVVIGGTSLFGGSGGVLGCFLGITLMGIISNALNMLNVSYFYQGTILGIIIIFAAVISTIFENKR